MALLNRHKGHRLPKIPLSAAALLVTVGIVFGDIGTSPLYVMKAITAACPDFDTDYILGALSCIIYTLTLQTTVKYVLIALHASNNGEGGILALYALLRRKGPKWLFFIAAIGAATLVADGVITPAVTVTSAIEGLDIVVKGAPVVPIVILIVISIFVMQRAGTDKIGKLFGPAMLAWFILLAVMGSINIGLAPTVFRSFNPWYAIKLLTGNPEWFLILGAVFLCTTGAEALYSDLGHCGRRNITVSWFFVKVCLILNYLGQGAWLIHAGHNAPGANPFFEIMPSWFIIPGVIMATMAAVIASQALISGSFTIFSEAISLDFWPRLGIKYTSDNRGQLYIPAVNWALMAGTLVTVLIFRTSSHMEAAYGLAITVTMLMTTLLLSFWLRTRGTPLWVIILFLTLFGVIEGGFFVANATKFMHGGWYTILISGAMLLIMIVWHTAMRLRNRYISHRSLSSSLPIIDDIRRDREIPLSASNLVYISQSDDLDTIEDKIFYSIVTRGPRRADRYWIMHIEYVDSPETLEYDVQPLLDGALINVRLRIGFRVSPKVNVYLRQIIEDLSGRGEFDITGSYSCQRKNAIQGNFRFIILHRIFSSDYVQSPWQQFIIRMHGLLQRLTQSDVDAYGLDTCNVELEKVPVVVRQAYPRRIRHRATIK